VNGKAGLLPWSIYRLVVVRMGRSLKETSGHWVKRTDTVADEMHGRPRWIVVFPGNDWGNDLGR